LYTVSARKKKKEWATVKKSKSLGRRRQNDEKKRGQDDRYQKLTVTGECEIFYEDLRIPHSKIWTLLA